MSTYIATVIRTGNSIALRVPKQYAIDAKLLPGQKVTLRLPTKQKQQDHAKIKRLIGNLQKLSAFSSLSDPLSWQRKIRQDKPLSGRDNI